jgi:hypothetical protein
MLYDFYNGNGQGRRIACTPVEHFKAQAHYQDATVTEISSILKVHGVGMHNVRRSHNINAVNAVRWVHVVNKNLDQTIRVLLAWCPDGNPDVFHQTLIRGMSCFLAQFPALDQAHLIDRLQRVTPVMAHARIKTAVRMTMGPGSKDMMRECVKYFVDTYNLSLRRRTEKLRMPPLRQESTDPHG